MCINFTKTRYIECKKFRATELYRSKSRTENNCTFVEYNGEVLSLVGWAEKYNIDRHLLYKRISEGWDIGKAVTTPVKNKKDNSLFYAYHIDNSERKYIGTWHNQSKCAKELGVSPGYINNTLNGKRIAVRGYDFVYMG